MAQSLSMIVARIRLGQHKRVLKPDMSFFFENFLGASTVEIAKPARGPP